MFKKSLALAGASGYILNMFKNEVESLEGPNKAKKADLTKKALYQTAIKLFTQKGFDKSTMREIAREAKVATGAIYYYYPSKESVIQDYYWELHEEHLEALGDLFEKEKSFEKRLHQTIRLKIDLAEPKKTLSRALFRVAANPQSPLSPFSEESRSTRIEAFKVFQDLVEGSNEKFHADLKKLLPFYLWFYQMGIILYWIYDSSEDSKKTYDLIDKTVPLVVYLNKKIQSPMAAPIRKKVLGVLNSFHGDLFLKGEKK